MLADWFRLYLCEIYVEIISGKERPPAKVLAANMLTLAKVMFTAEKRILALVEQIRQNPQFDPNGHFFGRSEMILGLLFKTKKKPTLAVQHLREAKRNSDRRPCSRKLKGRGGAWLIALLHRGDMTPGLRAVRAVRTISVDFSPQVRRTQPRCSTTNSFTSITSVRDVAQTSQMRK